MRKRTGVGALCLALIGTLVLPAMPAGAAPAGGYHPGEPPAVDPGEPTFTGSATPIPPEPAGYQPRGSMLRAIYNADIAAGGESYWFDRILARPFLSNADSALMTRGRALYMYTHNPRVLGFGAGGGGANGGGGYAYRQPPTTAAPQSLYTVGVTGDALVEDTTQRVQYPSYFAGVYTRPGLSVQEKKFITDNDVAVTDLTLTNTGTAALSTTLTAASPIATVASADGAELTGTVTLRYGLSTIFPRFSGDGFTAAGAGLTRAIALDPGASVTVKLQLGAVANEIPASATDYARYRAYDPRTAWLTQMREYNRFWVDTVPYLDLPDKNVEKISYYRTWLNRYNTFDGNIPGNDYQFPVDLEGALGYNNQISLTVPMRLQDLQFWRNPLYPYGSWLSQGEESGCQAFHDNPGNTGNWNNTYEQWTGVQAWQSYLVHGGPRSVVEKLAKYAECDLDGTLAKFDTNADHLIEYSSGTLPGNDADSVAFKYYGTRPQDRTESSYWYAEARTAADEYRLLGNKAKAAKMTAVAEAIRKAILSNLWAAGPVTNADDSGGGQATGPRVPGRLGNAVRLSGSNEFVNLPAGIVGGLSDFTISAWVNPDATTTWSRVFDFGTGTGDYMFLTVNAGGGPRFAITTGSGEQQLNAATQLPVGTWSHLAVTLSGSTGTLYVNGAAVATNTAMTLHPSSLGSTNQNWIGRSQFDDPYLDATVDDFQIYGHALAAADVAALAGGQPGAGDVADYRFDEQSGATAVDSSGSGHDATVVTLVRPTVTCPGKVFLQKDLTTGNLVCWKDQQNFAPFIDNVPPDTPEYTQALRYYADAAEFPIMPIYTADQADQAADVACEACSHGSNNFSNINATLQARLYSNALRAYSSQYITPDMYRQLMSWLAWNEDINGDNRFPDNNEFFFDWDPATKTYGRSGIHHDVLGSYNWMFFQDVAGLRPRLDDKVELWPIDMGLDHFTVNNLSYHGSDLTIVWQKPGGTVYYPAAPAGYSLYVDGRRVFTARTLAHVVVPAPLRAADQVSLAGNARLVDSFQKAGLDVSREHPAVDLAAGKATTASYAATTAANAVDGFTISGLPVTFGPYVGTNPIWGTLGSPDAQDWLQVDLGRATRFDTVQLYFYSNKAFGSGGSTYREPAACTVQYFDGSAWVDVPGQKASPATPAPNFNEVTFPPISARQVRVLVTPAAGRAVGVKELQIFDMRSGHGH
ncbi:LamG-like jellyroll fold domain-containing protein [Actinoplanes subtropicus]|uniref:LamG-like jellyroll fold domain-containing protein n=1 Tax=Actinoplanes subtropicus TaxID=543632 RepID=UPI0012F7EB48|nr:LamG-like jellyroll fold domain-containing protein [Actinoplanes subtropicus]